MFKINQIQLYVKVSEEVLYQCFSRIPIGYLIFIPKELALTEKVVKEAHISTSTAE